MADAKLLREVQIKSGILKRYVKEYSYYENELKKHMEKQETMKADPTTDEYMLKKQNELLQETRGLVPIAASNVKKARIALEQLIEANASALEGTEQLTEANQHIAASNLIQ